MLTIVRIFGVVAFSATDFHNFVYYAAPLSAIVAGVLFAREITAATIRSQLVSLSFRKAFQYNQTSV